MFFVPFRERRPFTCRGDGQLRLGWVYVKGMTAKEHLIHHFVVPLLPFRLNGRGVSFAGSLLPLPCGVTRHSKTIINCFRTAYPPEKAFEGKPPRDAVVLRSRHCREGTDVQCTPLRLKIWVRSVGATIGRPPFFLFVGFAKGQRLRMPPLCKGRWQPLVG